MAHRERGAGEVLLHGKKDCRTNRQVEAIKNGFALVTEERRSTGIFWRTGY